MTEKSVATTQALLQYKKLLKLRYRSAIFLIVIVLLVQIYAAVVARESVENEKNPPYVEAVIRDYGVSTTKQSKNFYVLLNDTVVVHKKQETPFSGVQRLVVKFSNADSKRQMFDDLIKNKESVIIYGNIGDDFLNATKMLNKKT